MSNTIKHYGTPMLSGRYPYGSGDKPQRSTSFRQSVLDLKKKGLSESDIAKGFGMTTTKMRAKISLEKTAERRAKTRLAVRLKDKGYSNTAIGERMNLNESSVRALLDPAQQERAAITGATADMLRAQVERKKYLDVGAGVETQIGVSRTRLNNAVIQLEGEGYKVQYVQVEQLGTGKQTSMKILTRDDVTGSELYKNKSEIRAVSDWTEDGGRTYLGLHPVKHVSSDRILVLYEENGGADRDGVIQLRRGVKDLSLGDAKYAQVRVGVDETHYLKGMAVYSDKIPDGYDIVYNTNKPQKGGPKGAMKALKDDPDNPFGATVRQSFYIDDDGKRQVSPLNIVGFASKTGSGEEGSWDTWSTTLSSQFLSKQTPALAKRQLEIGLDIHRKEFDEIMTLTNPAVRSRLLDSFADDCDSRAVHLKAAALPRQANKVLLPIPSLKEGEVYAPTFKNGEKLALVRHPHGGIFEIPVVQVNNRNREGKSVLANALDAIGIHPKTAQKLSGADFDGDTVLAIPYSKRLKTARALEGLKDFDPKHAYPKRPGMRVISPENKQLEMGKVSNLITDMTIKGASSAEIARAVRHSMVVIDAEKWELDYKGSYADNGIANLKARYQGGTPAQPKGAATLVSRSASTVRVPERRAVTKDDIANNPKLKGSVRRGDYSVDPKTGRKVYVNTEETYTDSKGKTVRRMRKSQRMFEETDAMKLSSGTVIERVYADYANSMKALGDKARLASINTPSIKTSPTAKKTYASAVASLKAKLTIANSNKPLERQAQLLANHVFNQKKTDKPGMTAAERKKVKGQALEEARRRTGAKKQRINITAAEWEAIQSGAVTHNTLVQILNNADLDAVKQLATPRSKPSLPPSKKRRAETLLNSGYTQAEVATRLGVSVGVLVQGLDETTIGGN